MTEDMSKYGDKKFEGPPLNFKPEEGDYTFTVVAIKEKDVKKNVKGIPMVTVGLRSQCGAYVRATFHGTAKSMPRLASFLEAAGGQKVSTATITDEFSIADAINAVVKKSVKATVKKGEPWTNKSGEVVTNYDVSSFKPAF
jgi:hypothetical protein